MRVDLRHERHQRPILLRSVSGPGSLCDFRWDSVRADGSFVSNPRKYPYGW